MHFVRGLVRTGNEGGINVENLRAVWESGWAIGLLAAVNSWANPEGAEMLQGCSGLSRLSPESCNIRR